MVAPPQQRLDLVGPSTFTLGSVLGALSATKFVTIDYTAGTFRLFEVADGTYSEIDSVAHDYPEDPNLNGHYTGTPPAARWCQSAPGGTRAVTYLGYYLSTGDYAVCSQITLDGGGLLSVQTIDTDGFGYDTTEVLRVLPSAWDGIVTGWEFASGVFLGNAPNSGIVDGLWSPGVPSGEMIVAYSNRRLSGLFSDSYVSASGTVTGTVTLTCEGNALTFTHPAGSRVHDWDVADVVYESTLQYVPLGFNRILILGADGADLTYRVFVFDGLSMAWEGGWTTVTVPLGFAADQYPRASTWDGTRLAIAYVQDYWG